MRSKEQEGEGRLPRNEEGHGAEQPGSHRDISLIDQQEGNMHRGETGGNFREEEEEEEKAKAEKNPQ
jgi:hypothetical protein